MTNSLIFWMRIFLSVFGAIFSSGFLRDVENFIDSALRFAGLNNITIVSIESIISLGVVYLPIFVIDWLHEDQLILEIMELNLLLLVFLYKNS